MGGGKSVCVGWLLVCVGCVCVCVCNVCVYCVCVCVCAVCVRAVCVCVQCVCVQCVYTCSVCMHVKRWSTWLDKTRSEWLCTTTQLKHISYQLSSFVLNCPLPPPVINNDDMLSDKVQKVKV